MLKAMDLARNQKVLQVVHPHQMMRTKTERVKRRRTKDQETKKIQIRRKENNSWKSSETSEWFNFSTFSRKITGTSPPSGIKILTIQF